MVDARGEVIGRQDYSAYGSVVAQSGLMPSVGYAGMWQHHDSGINLTWYRGYQPAAGRWLSRDPIGELGGLNLYGYAMGDPVLLIDPSGLAAIGCVDMVFGRPRRETTEERELTYIYSVFSPGLIFESPGLKPDVGMNPRLPKIPPVKPGVDWYFVVDRFDHYVDNLYAVDRVFQGFMKRCRWMEKRTCGGEIERSSYGNPVEREVERRRRKVFERAEVRKLRVFQLAVPFL